MVRILETTSKLESEREIRLYPELPGVAVELLAEEGDLVVEGAILARLDHRTEDLEVRDAEVGLSEAKDAQGLAELAITEGEANVKSAALAARQAERDYERDLTLSQSSDVANPLSKQALEARLLARENALHAEEQAKLELERRRAQLESSRTAISRAEVTLERARLARSKKELRAPFAGVIAERRIRVGDNVGTAEHAFVLSDTERLRAVFARPQEELALFSPVGQRATAAEGDFHLTLTATTEAYPGRVFEGWIERISPTIEADSGQFRVVARLRPAAGPAEYEDGPRSPLLPGMLVRLKIATDRHPSALVVPKRALRREGERRYVLRLDADDPGTLRVRRIDVEEGFSDAERVEVVALSGETLRPADRVVLVGSRELADGDQVRLEADPAAQLPGTE